MAKYSHPLHLRVTLPVAVVTIVIVGILISFLTHDPHWLNRSGALIAAIAAAATLLQINIEIGLEDARGGIEEQVKKVKNEQHAWDTAGAGPLQDLELRLIIKRLEVRSKEIAQRRLHVALYVISSAMLGELLHGFGDLLMCHLFSVCVVH